MDGQDNNATQAPPLAHSRPPSPPAQNIDTEHLSQRAESPDAALPSVGIATFSDGPTQGTERQLNVSDALSYLDSVKSKFHDQPEVYNKFLDIMKDFKAQAIDTPGVIERVSNLFHGHPTLIQGFNTFLPAGYRIETTDNPDPNYITVTTPAGTTLQATNGAFKYGSKDVPAPEDTGEMKTVPKEEPDVRDMQAEVDLQPALAFVQKIRTRYANHPEVYRQFLHILAQATEPGVSGTEGIGGMETVSVACLSAKVPKGDMIRRMMNLLKDETGLMREFVQFIPDEVVQKEELGRIARLEESRKASEAKAKRNGDGHGSASAAVPQKRKRKPAERDKDKDKDKEPAPRGGAAKKAKMQASSEAPSPALTQRQAAAAAPPSPLRAPPQQPPPQAFYPHHQTVALPPPIPIPVQPSSSMHSNDEAHFFDRVKRALDNRETYNEFLKLVNLFTQDIINTTRLVREARTFLGDGELMMQFKDILGWDGNNERMSALEESWTRPMSVLDRPSRNQLHSRYGSYRKLPAHEVNVECSGRDEMCNAVLNDEWVVQPTFASEDVGFFTHKKNIYEEALHRSEEERHEYDFHVEAISRTILVLEPLNSKIMQLTPEERASFKLKANLGGVGKAIHQRVIKKIYGRDVGVEVWAAMQEVPGTAIPVVLMRLKQKQDEWRRAQREWDKVWREVDARNYHKSLDHQAVTFKAADKKAITQKAFVSQIEAARDEQRVMRASLVDPLLARTKPRHQLEFVVEDPTVLQDTLKLALAFLDRTQGQISLPDRRKVETFLRSFIPLFFMLDSNTFNAAFVPHHETLDSDDAEGAGEDVDMASNASGSSRSRGKKGGAHNPGDLRKRLLKSEQAKSSRRTRAQEAASPTPSRFASPALSDPMQVDASSDAGKIEKASMRRRGTFYTNTAFYVLLRLLELLYSRLYLFKTVTKELSERSNDPSEPNPNSIKASVQADLAKLGDRLEHAAHFYDLMVESCEKLFDNELEQNSFEEMMRYMFGVKHAYKMFTVDKVVGAFVKQVQTILSDPKSLDLYELLRREREIPSPTTQDLINSRRNTERVLGPDENLFRFDWMPESKTMTIQLIGKDDGTYDDSEVMTGRWQAYIESFVSHHYTAGVPSSSTIRRPFLLRTKIPSPSGAMPDILARGGLQIKVCVRTYRLFFVAHSEDIMFRLSSAEERANARKSVESRNQKRKRWLDEYAAKTLKDEPKSATLETAPKPPATNPPPPEPQQESYEAAPEVPPRDQAPEVQMEAAAEEPMKEKQSVVAVFTAPQDDPVEAAAAAAVVGPAPNPDSADVSMGEATPEAATLPAPVPDPAPESVMAVVLEAAQAALSEQTPQPSSSPAAARSYDSASEQPAAPAAVESQTTAGPAAPPVPSESLAPPSVLRVSEIVGGREPTSAPLPQPALAQEPSAQSVSAPAPPPKPVDCETQPRPAPPEPAPPS